MDDSAPKENKKCDPEEFVEAHWRAFLAEDGRKVEDTYLTNGIEKPPEVRIGAFQVVRCLDLALPQMEVG